MKQSPLLILAAFALSAAPFKESNALAVSDCSSMMMGQVFSPDGNGPDGGYDLSAASCNVNWSRSAEASASYPADIEHPELLATASGQISANLERGLTTTADGLVLSGSATATGEAESHAVLMNPGPQQYYFGINIDSMNDAYGFATINLNPNERYRYELQATVAGQGSVYFGITNEQFMAAGSAAEFFYRGGIVDGATLQSFVVNFGASAAPRTGAARPDYYTSVFGAASYQLTFTPVPLPAAFILLASGLGLLPLVRKRT